MAHRFATLDVFTDTALTGNPLAVVYDADDLDDKAMQAIAREFNLSETVFVTKPAKPMHSARLRIFTPMGELPFAGHPTVGTAVLLAMDRAGGAVSSETDLIVVLEEQVGIVRAAVVLKPDQPGYAIFDVPKQAEQIPGETDRDVIAPALGLTRHDIGTTSRRSTPLACRLPSCRFTTWPPCAGFPSIRRPGTRPSAPPAMRPPSPIAARRNRNPASSMRACSRRAWAS